MYRFIAIGLILLWGSILFLSNVYYKVEANDAPLVQTNTELRTTITPPSANILDNTTECPPELKTDFGCIPPDPIGFVQKFYGLAIGFIGGVAFLFLIIGGYYLLTSGGNPEKLQTGKNYIFYSLAGLLLALFGFVFIQLIARDVLKVPGF